MNSNPIPIGRSTRLALLDVRELGRALVLACVVACVVTASSIASDYADRTSPPLAPRADVAASAASEHREPTSIDAPLRGLSPSEIWAADESAHGLRPDAAH